MDIKRCDMLTQWSTTQQKKRWHLKIWKQMDRARKKIPSEVTQTQKDRHDM